MYRRFLIAAVVSFGLGSCTVTEAVKKAGAYGDVLEELVKEDLDAARKYREQRRLAIDDVFDECMGRADDLADDVLWPEAMVAFQDCLDILKDNPPILLIERAHELRKKMNPDHSHGD